MDRCQLQPAHEGRDHKFGVIEALPPDDIPLDDIYPSLVTYMTF